MSFRIYLKATVQASIGGIALSMGLTSGAIILTVSIVSILVTAPIGAFLIEYFGPKLLNKHDKYYVETVKIIEEGE